MRNILTSKWTKIVVFLTCLYPVGELVYRMIRQDLGANPVEYITHQTGVWALRFLAITLAITPLRKLAGLPDLIRFRRMTGLFAFFYAWMHFMTWAVLDKQFDLSDMWRDFWKRPFITAGAAALLMMIPLAITSTAGWIRRLGGKRWQLLHRLIYFSAIAGVIHYYWLVKSDVAVHWRTPPVFAVLLGARLVVSAQRDVQ